MEKLKLGYTILSLIISMIAATFYLRRRLKRRRMCCYLVTDESKPQHFFKHVLADNSYTLFKHLNQPEVSKSHPYEKEILDLLVNSRIEKLRFVNSEVNLKSDLKEHYVWVDKEEQLRDLLEVLSREIVFAVDIEHHSLRSFLGFTALMQISTHTEDYLVDTIALHDVVNILRPVFANPNICKVFHGADNDVIWLQRDFHIYVVNLFDTAKACEVLSKPQKSLAYLLETFCGVATNKLLQCEDWRVRPLSEEMIGYARTDAHYLLYIADRMASELKELEVVDGKFHFLLEASRLSNRISLQHYTKPIETSVASSISLRFLNAHGVPLKSETMELVEWWCIWRDIMARVHDESLRFVLPDEAIVALASEAPVTEAELYKTISDSGLSSPVISSHLEDICYLLSEKINNLDDVIQKHLGPSGGCPLSIYNYALLKKSHLMASHGFSAKQNRGMTSKRFSGKEKESNRTCKSPVYDNCAVYGSDGRLLRYTYPSKIEWYLRQDLAKVVQKDPPGIMLHSECKRHPKDEDHDFYTQRKINMCVGCGETNHYLRYKIIPSCYTVHFPKHLKSYWSESVLVCIDCQKLAHLAAQKLKNRIATEVRIPLWDSRQSEDIIGATGSEEAGASLWKLRSVALALVRHGSDMPSTRREELTQTVMKFFGGRKLSEKDLERALLVGMSPHERRRLENKERISPGGQLSNMADASIDDVHECFRKISSLEHNHNSHGKQVVDHLLKEYGEDGIHDFCRRWRQVFVDAIQPRFLPSGWDVNVMHRGACFNCGDFSHHEHACPKLQE